MLSIDVVVILVVKGAVAWKWELPGQPDAVHKSTEGLPENFNSVLSYMVEVAVLWRHLSLPRYHYCNAWPKAHGFAVQCASRCICGELEQDIAMYGVLSFCRCQYWVASPTVLSFAIEEMLVPNPGSSVPSSIGESRSVPKDFEAAEAKNLGIQLAIPSSNCENLYICIHPIDITSRLPQACGFLSYYEWEVVCPALLITRVCYRSDSLDAFPC